VQPLIQLMYGLYYYVVLCVNTYSWSGCGVEWVIIIVIMFDCQSELLLKVLGECNVNWFAEVCDHVDVWSYVEGGWDMLFVAL